MTAEIVSVGTELLLGQIANTDAQYLSKVLAGLGISLYRHTAVGDNPARIRQALTEAAARADLVITTGGLGPTVDDITKQAVADLCGVTLELHKPSLAAIEAWFEKVGRMPPANQCQAYFPPNCDILPNRVGTAPGCLVQSAEGTRFLLLSGPPFELQDMMQNAALPLLRGLTDGVILSRVLRITGHGESAVESMVVDIIRECDNPTVAPLIGRGDVTLRITARAATEDEANAAMDPVEARLRQRLGDAVYAVGEHDITAVMAHRLMQSGKTISVAESCTGGLLSDAFLQVPGMSASFLSGIVAYANEQKTALLGVPADMIAAHGAVSEQVAAAMARGARRISGADYALSTTGIAGPGGGTPEKPVGTVYIACDSEKGTQVRLLQLRGGRERIRELTVIRACFLLWENF